MAKLTEPEAIAADWTVERARESLPAEFRQAVRREFALHGQELSEEIDALVDDDLSVR